MPDVFTSPQNLPQHKVPYGLPQEKKGGIFSAFRAYPENITFENKDKEEKIILMLRQHPIINLVWIVVSAVIFLCPFVLQTIGFFSMFPPGYRLVIQMVFILISFVYAIEGFYKWYFNVFFITNKRVMDVDFYNIINRKVTDAELKNIQDVTYMTSGAIGTVFKFGNVLVQTASEIPELIFLRVPDPEKVANVLDDLRKPIG